MQTRSLVAAILVVCLVLIFAAFTLGHALGRTPGTQAPVKGGAS